MEILGKWTKKRSTKKNHYLSEFKMFVAIEHKLDTKPVVPPSKWAWNNFWTNHIRALQHSGFLSIYAGKMMKRVKNGDKHDKNHHDYVVTEVSPKEMVYICIKLSICLTTSLGMLARPCVWLITNIELFATILSTWWKAFRWWILCSPKRKSKCI